MNNTMFKRVLAMVLTLCMVLSVCPVTAFAADYAVGDTYKSTDNITPAAPDGTAWVSTGTTKELECEYKLYGENGHTHSLGTCYWKSCDHSDGTHPKSEYGSSWGICNGAGCEHTNSADFTDLTWKNATSKLGAVDADLLTYLKNTYGEGSWSKLLANYSSVAGKVFCYTIDLDKLNCQHDMTACADIASDHYTWLCRLTEHLHEDSCYTTYYNWKLCADANGNGEDDATEAKYTVTYVDGLGNELSKTENILSGTATPAAPTATRTNYNFVAWSPKWTDIVSENITYTAQWDPVNDEDQDGIADEEEKIIITFKSDDEVVASNEYVHGATVTAPTVTKEGYNFSAWNPNFEATAKVPADGTNAITYTAVWSKNLTVTFESNGSVIDTKEVVSGATVAEPTAPTREGYDFKGWKLDGNDYDFATPVTENITLVAQWMADANNNDIDDTTEKKYTVVFDYACTEYTNESSEILTGMPTPAPSTVNPEREGYTFTGWSPDYTKVATVTADATYKAIWIGDANKNGVDDSLETVAVGETTNGTATVNGGASVVYNSKGDEAAKTITVVATPDADYYVASIEVGEKTLTPTYSSGVATATFVAEGSQTVNVSFASIMSVGETIDVDYNEYMDKSDIQAEVLSKLTTAEGVDRSSIKVEYLAYTIPLVGTEIWIEVGDTYKISDNLIVKFSDGHTVRYTYEGSADGKFTATTVTTTANVADRRADSQITVNEAEKTVGLYDLEKSEKLTYTESAILEVFGAVVDAEKNAYPAVARVTKEGATLPVYVEGIGTFAGLTETGVYTITLDFDGNQDYKAAADVVVTLTIEDNRLNTQVNLTAKTSKEDAIVYSSVDPITEEEIFNHVTADTVESGIVTDENGKSVTYAYSDANVTLYKGNNEITADKITEGGTYKIKVVFPETNTYHASEATVEFIVDDGRDIVEVNWKSEEDPAQIGWFAWDKTEDTLKSALIKSVVYGEDSLSATAGSDFTGYAVSFDTAVADMELEGEYKITVSYAGDAAVAPFEYSLNFVLFDDRIETTIEVNENQSITYRADLTEEDIFKLVFKAVTAGGETVEYKPEEIEYTASTLNAGEGTATINYLGDDTYKPATATVTYTVTKANANVTVDPATVRYDGNPHSANVTVTPADADYIEFAVGIDFGQSGAGDLGATAYINLPNLVDLSALEKAVDEATDPVQKAIAEAVLSVAKKAVDELNAGIGGVTNIDDLIKLIESIESTAGNIPGLNIDLTAVTTLKAVLEEIQSVSGITNLTLNLTMGQDGVAVTNAGFYIAGAVVSDANYNTTVGLNYLIISPDGAKCEIQWNYTDDNGFITRGLLLAQEDLLGASATLTGTESWANQTDADKYLTEILFGYDVVNNELTLINLSDGTTEDSLMPGAYTEIAFFRNLGNQMYYDDPEVRPVVIVADMVEIRFVDANENNAFLRTFDGTPKNVTAEVYDRDGNKLDETEQAKITYRYMGVESDGEIYNSTSAPSQTGTYTVIATYNDGNNDVVGVGMAALVIAPAEASVSVESKVVTVKEAPVELESLITKTPADAKMAVIMAKVSSVSDFSEEGLAAVDGKIYLDLPNRIDEALEKVGVTGGVYNVTTLLNYIQKAEELLASMGVDISALDQITAQLETIGTEHSIILVDELSEIADPAEIGVYAIVAAIVDNNYVPAIDSGLVIITPETTDVELKWNYNDINGIITRPLVEQADMKASAYKDGEEYACLIEYVIFGVGEDGETYTITDPNEIKNLPNGAYTQIAYIPVEIDDNMIVAAPIVREFILVPQSVTIDCTGGTFTYDGEAHPAAVVVKDAAGNEITGELLNNLTVTYTGVGTEGAVSTSEAPTAAGVYAVTAVYKELNEDGTLARFGMGIGQVTIEPARLGYDIEDSVHTYTGGEHDPVITMGEAEHDILFIVDTQNATVNVIAPSLGEDKDPNYNWDGDIHIQYWLTELENVIAQLETETGVNAVEVLENLLAKLPEEITSSDTYNDLVRVLSDIDSDKLTLNKELPIEPGKYTIYGIAYKDPNHVIEISEGVMTIVEENAVQFPVGEKNIAEGTVIFIDGVPAGALDEDGILWLEEMPESGIAVTYSYNKANSASAYPGHNYDVYPTQMYVWEFTLETDEAQPCCEHYKAERIEELDNILQYTGTSVRLSNEAVSGIRIFTGMETAKRETLLAGALTDSALAGYKLTDWGSIASKSTKDLYPTIGTNDAINKSGNGNYIDGNGQFVFYNTMTNINKDTVDMDFMFRPYIVLENGENTITIYGGTVQRCVSYVAWQNRSTYAPGSSLENAEFHGYVWNLINMSEKTYLDN